MAGKIVAVINYRDFILIFTEHGFVYRMDFDELTQQFTSQKVMRLDESQTRIPLPRNQKASP